MKKLLIVCDMFPPAFAPRMGYLCKYLKRAGWDPVIVTEAIEDNTFHFLANECRVTYISYYTAKNKYVRKLQWLLIFILDFCVGYKDFRMYKTACQLIRKHSCELILCSTYRTFPLSAAQKASAKFNLPLVADLRDMIEQYTGNEFITHKLPALGGLDKVMVSIFRKKNLHTRNRVLEKAAYVTTISPWHVQQLQKYNSNVELIYNGFDPELFYPEQITTSQFIITYTGRLVSIAMRDPGLLLEAISILSKEQIISPEQFRVHWYVDDMSRDIIAKEAEKAGVIAFMDWNGYVPATKVPQLLNSSSVLLLLTNKSGDDGPKGVMTTKLFESLAVEKPILCVRSDESYVEMILQQTHAGLAAGNVEEVCHFLKSLYTEWKEKGYTTANVNKEMIELFSRRKQAEQFINLFERL